MPILADYFNHIKMEEKKIGRMERDRPYLYSGRIDCKFNLYELQMLRNALDVDILALQRLIDGTSDDDNRYDLMTMKITRKEIRDRVADMITADIGKGKSDGVEEEELF
jgi:hypothetical protein